MHLGKRKLIFRTCFFLFWGLIYGKFCIKICFAALSPPFLVRWSHCISWAMHLPHVYSLHPWIDPLSPPHPIFALAWEKGLSDDHVLVFKDFNLFFNLATSYVLLYEKTSQRMHVFPLCRCFSMTCLEMSHRGASCCFHIAFRNIQALSVNLRKKKFKTSCKIENVIMCCADRAGHFSSPPLQGPQIRKEPLPCFILGVTLGSVECFELACQWSV